MLLLKARSTNNNTQIMNNSASLNSELQQQQRTCTNSGTQQRNNGNNDIENTNGFDPLTDTAENEIICNNSNQPIKRLRLTMTNSDHHHHSSSPYVIPSAIGNDQAYYIESTILPEVQGDIYSNQKYMSHNQDIYQNHNHLHQPPTTTSVQHSIPAAHLQPPTPHNPPHNLTTLGGQEDATATIIPPSSGPCSWYPENYHNLGPATVPAEVTSAQAPNYFHMYNTLAHNNIYSNHSELATTQMQYHSHPTQDHHYATNS